MTRVLPPVVWAAVCCGPFLLLHAEEPVISASMAAALEGFNPAFEPWKVRDYTPNIWRVAARDGRRPYALELDFNGDGKSDLVLDGHDKEKSILLCLISRSDGYDVLVVRESRLVVPAEIENWYEGRSETGLSRLLVPYKDGTGFALAFPQQTDSEGNLLTDGAMIDYVFRDGEFRESHQAL